MSEAPLSKEEKRAAKKIAKTWKKFQARLSSHKMRFTGMEPVLALAMDLERSLVLLVPYVLEGLYPTPVSLETLGEPDSMKAAFDNIMWNLSKNVRGWSPSIHKTDYSVRLEELAIKMLDQDMDSVVNFSSWCFMNAPTYQTFQCLEHLDQVDWSYTLGQSDVMDDSKLHIPTHDIVDSRLVSVPYQLRERRYKYACSPKASTPFSVLSEWIVEEASHDRVVVSDNGRYCQLRLPENPYLAAFLKADEQKQAVTRFLWQRDTEFLKGGNKLDLTRREPVYGLKVENENISFHVLFKVLGLVLGLTLMTMLFSSVSSATSRCTYRARDPDVPMCVENLFALQVKYVLPSVPHLKNLQVASSMLEDCSFLCQLSHVVQGKELSDDMTVKQIEAETLDAFKEATVGNALVGVVQQSGVSAEQQVGLFQNVWAYAVETWSPRAPTLYFNLSSLPQIEQLSLAFQEIQESMPEVNVREDIISLDNLANSLKRKEMLTNVTNVTIDSQFLQIQAQLYALQKTLNFQFQFLNQRFFKVLESVANLTDLVNKVNEEFNIVIADITPSIGALFLENKNPQALVTQDTDFRMPEYRYRSKLKQLSHNYRMLLQEVALPLYTLDSNMHTFPEKMRNRLTSDIATIVNTLKDLMTQMLKLKHLVGLHDQSFIVRWLEPLLGDYRPYDSVKAAKVVTRKVVALNLDIIEKNKDSYQLLSRVMEKMQNMQDDLRRNYSVAKEHFVTASIHMYSQFVTSSLKRLPSVVGLNDQFFQVLSPYLNLADILDDWRARAEESNRNLHEKLMFTSRTRLATEVATGALIDSCSLGLNLIERAKTFLWKDDEGRSVKKIIAVLEYALYFGMYSGQAVQAGVNFFALGDIPTITVPVPDVLKKLGFPVLTVSEANLRDWSVPKVELTFRNTTFTIPKYYLRADETDPKEERKMQIMLQHLVRKYTDYSGPFDMESEDQWLELEKYLNRTKTQSGTV